MPAKEKLISRFRGMEKVCSPLGATSDIDGVLGSVGRSEGREVDIDNRPGEVETLFNLREMLRGSTNEASLFRFLKLVGGSSEVDESSCITDRLGTMPPPVLLSPATWDATTLLGRGRPLRRLAVMELGRAAQALWVSLVSELAFNGSPALPVPRRACDRSIRPGRGLNGRLSMLTVEGVGDGSRYLSLPSLGDGGTFLSLDVVPLVS